MLGLSYFCGLLRAAHGCSSPLILLKVKHTIPHLILLSIIICHCKVIVSLNQNYQQMKIIFSQFHLSQNLTFESWADNLENKHLFCRRLM